MSEEQLIKHFIPFLNKLSSKDWYTSRSAAASLYHIVFSRISEKYKNDLSTSFLRLCRDETPSVRRIASQFLVPMFKAARSSENQSFLSSLLEVYRSLCNDDQDSIRIQVSPISISLAANVSSEIAISQILPAVLSIAADKSWRVRWSLAHRMHQIIELFPSNEGKYIYIYLI